MALRQFRFLREGLEREGGRRYRGGVVSAPVTIREETDADAGAIRNVNELAFGRPDEASIVDALRDHGKSFLSLVAVIGDEVVGHVMFSPFTIEAGGEMRAEAALAPLAVLPAWQGRGIGSALAREGLERCRALGYGAVFLLGNPAYYGRFGFRPASAFGIRYAGELAAPDAFQAVELRAGALSGMAGIGRFEPELM
ncbi:MAG TPA: N-acetyltransferase [Dehalococcoidia bacterium]|nr:N-acetyltransferase [Dehalococcoidia bacterium]